jgi:hypothetical protein
LMLIGSCLEFGGYGSSIKNGSLVCSDAAVA